MTDAGKCDVGSLFYLVPHKGCVTCGLCSPLVIRMEKVTSWAGVGLDTPYGNLHGMCLLLLPQESPGSS